MTRRPEDDGAGGGRLSGWSRRKLAARRGGADAQDTTLPTEARDAAGLDAGVESDGVDVDYIAALPPIETIADGSDIKPFLARGVPASLKNAAMRRLWSASPSVRDYADPAVDYAWDWNAPGGVPGGGGTLTERGVAKMVKDLIGGSPTEEDEDASVRDVAEKRDSEADPERLADTPPERVPDTGEPPVAIRRTQGLDEPKSGGGSDPPKGARPIVLATAPRRHGGARPD